MAKKASKARRKEPQAAAPVQLVEAPEQEQALEQSPAVFTQAAPAAERPSQAPIMTPPTAEALAAHDSFVRSPSAVVESLGIRMTSAVAKRLASIPPPAPAAPQDA